MSKKQVYWTLLLVASSIAALVSLLTTALGLEKYVPAVLAWMLSFAVQAGLFGMAWLIGETRRGQQTLVIVLYCLTMPFSVAFSYVTLQSEFSEEIRPQESQRALFDQIRQDAALIDSKVLQAVGAIDEVVLRLESWLEMERQTGWATETCEEAEHCYLVRSCNRIRERIALWEDRQGRAYVQGPGEQLIFSLLNTEIKAAKGIADRLKASIRPWSTQDVWKASIDNRERLARYDRARADIPVAALESALCGTVALPPAPEFEKFARDDALLEEQPVYAFDDLMVMLDSEHKLGRADYPTVFALLLAGFIDLFVLLVAISAGSLGAQTSRATAYPGVRPMPETWEQEAERDVESWIEGALLADARDSEKRRRFLNSLFESMNFDQGGSCVLAPSDRAQRRFGYCLLKAKAARQEQMRTGKDGAEQTVFVLEDWVYPAVVSALRSEEPAAGVTEGAEVHSSTGWDFSESEVFPGSAALDEVAVDSEEVMSL